MIGTREGYRLFDLLLRNEREFKRYYNLYYILYKQARKIADGDNSYISIFQDTIFENSDILPEGVYIKLQDQLKLAYEATNRRCCHCHCH